MLTWKSIWKASIDNTALFIGKRLDCWPGLGHPGELQSRFEDIRVSHISEVATLDTNANRPTSVLFDALTDDVLDSSRSQKGKPKNFNLQNPDRLSRKLKWKDQYEAASKRKGKRKGKNDQQQVFAGSHPPNY